MATEATDVNEYFAEKFGGDYVPIHQFDLPLDSNCGQDCKKAIDAAAAFCDHIKAAYGADTMEEREVAQVCHYVCCVYANG